MAITDTIQAKDFKAGAPDITLKGDLRPNQMMASNPDPMAELNSLSLMLYKKPLSDLTDDEYESLQEAARDSLAVGGRAQYGLGSIVKSVGKAVKGVAKGVKKVAKSDLGKTALTATALYYAPALFKGTPGFGPGSTYRNFFGNLSLPSIPGIPGLSDKAKGTLGAFAIGSLGSAAISAAEAGGLDTSDPNAEVDVESIKGYLSRGYKNLNPNATDEEVFQFVQENTAEYRAMGGRIGYADGTPSFEEYLREREMLDKKGNMERLMKEYKEDMRRKKVMQQKQEAADGGRIGYADGDEDPIIKKLRILPDTLDKIAEKIAPLLGYEPEDIKKIIKERAKQAQGGRIGYAMGTEDKVEMASGIESLPINVNSKGVKELDLRETGGFIPPVGIKEKADDIPAMLSNNEFVFTADAVRAAGGGDIDKGAQLMYDTMRRLESKVV
jgi:hypothetical protein